MKMPNIRDFAGEGKVVILHSEIRDVHRLAADVDYFLSCEDALHVVTQKDKNKQNNGLSPRPLP